MAFKEPKTGEVLVVQESSDPVIAIAKDTFSKERQLIVFVNTKRGAESQAEKIAAKLETSAELEFLSEKALSVLATPTKQCKRLATCLKKGVAFHHAGLHSKQRELIETGFKEKIIKAICATPTLCLHKDTLIWSGIKEKSVARIKSGSQITSLKENSSRHIRVEESHKLPNNYKKMVLITSVSGHVVSLTPNHQVLIRRNGKRMLLQAGLCKKTDYIATQGQIHIKSKNVFFSKFIKDNKLPFEDRKLEPSDYYLLGAMLGDGYSGACFKEKCINYKGSPSIVGIDKEIFLQIKNSCKSYGLLVRTSKTFHNIPQLILGKNKWFREYLCRTGIEQKENKHIHQSLLAAPKECITSLLRGLFDTDGYVNKDKSVGFSSISYVMIRQMQRLLLRFGIVSRLRQKKASSIKIYDKTYLTKKSYEITISNKESILLFYGHINFSLKRKQESLERLVLKITSNIHYISCSSCNYKLYADVFNGRSKEQKKWSEQKKKILYYLGVHGEKGSRTIARNLGFEPKKRDSKLNHHYEFISKKKIGNISNNEWFWSLNSIGKYVYSEYIKKNIDIKNFFSQTDCPLCSQNLTRRIKNGWRSKDKEEDIYWDKISLIESKNDDSDVYDIVLPSDGSNDHLLVANGIFVHNSAGLDLPAFRVIIRDLKRYGGPWGMTNIPVLEYFQMAGRAGRPGKDPWGEAICIAKTESEKDSIVETYINGEPEEIYSKLAVEPVLRTYVLSLVASGYVNTTTKLFDFFSKTFYAHQYGDLSKLQGILERMIQQLQQWGFLEGAAVQQDDFVSANKIEQTNEPLKATVLGKRVSELYLDPYTAYHLLKGLQRTKKKSPTIFSYLHLASSCLELRPYLKVRTAELDLIEDKLAKEETSLLHIAPNDYSDEYETYIDTIKTAMLFEAWIEETTEDELFTHYNVRPGELHAKLELADWLLYAAIEIAKLTNHKKPRSELFKLRTRLKHGAKEELLTLLKLKGVGRVRARKLYKANIKDVTGLKHVDATSLAQLVGKATAIKLKEQVGEQIDPEKIVVKQNKRKGQKSLQDY